MKKDEEKYGVIVCSDCRTAKIVDLNDETSECHKCGRRLKLERMKIHYKTASRKEASWVIGRLNAKMRGGELPEQEDEEKEEKDPFLKASEKAEVASDEKERLQNVSRVLSEEKGKFEVSDVEEVYELLDREDDELEKKLKKLEEIYEPEEGIFKYV